MKKRLAFGVAGTVMIALTLCFFFLLSFKKSDVSWWALGFVLLSEAALLLGLWSAWTYDDFSNRIFIRSGLSVTLLLYFFATAITALFSGAFRENRNSFILIELIITAAAILISLLIILYSARINLSDEKILSDRKLMQLCEKNVYELMSDSKNKTYQEQLNKIYEKIKYCDKIGASSYDDKFVGAVMKLEKLLSSPKPRRMI